MKLYFENISNLFTSTSVLVNYFKVLGVLIFLGGGVFYKYFIKQGDFSTLKPAAVFCDHWTAWRTVQVSNLMNLLLLVLYLSLPFLFVKPSEVIELNMFYFSLNFLFRR